MGMPDTILHLSGTSNNWRHVRRAIRLRASAQCHGTCRVCNGRRSLVIGSSPRTSHVARQCTWHVRTLQPDVHVARGTPQRDSGLSMVAMNTEPADIELIKTAPDGDPGALTSRTRRLAVLVLVLVVLLGAAGGYVLWRRGQTTSPQPATTQPADAVKLRQETTQVPLPPLEATDALVRQLVGGLSSHPVVAAWLATDRLIVNFVVVTGRIADGQTPVAELKAIGPVGASFRVRTSQGRITIDPASYRRYDRYAQAVSALDAQGAARVYETLETARERSRPELRRYRQLRCGAGARHRRTVEGARGRRRRAVATWQASATRSPIRGWKRYRRRRSSCSAWGRRTCGRSRASCVRSRRRSAFPTSRLPAGSIKNAGRIVPAGVRPRLRITALARVPSRQLIAPSDCRAQRYVIARSDRRQLRIHSSRQVPRFLRTGTSRSHTRDGPARTDRPCRSAGRRRAPLRRSSR